MMGDRSLTNTMHMHPHTLYPNTIAWESRRPERLWVHNSQSMGAFIELESVQPVRTRSMSRCSIKVNFSVYCGSPCSVKKWTVSRATIATPQTATRYHTNEFVLPWPLLSSTFLQPKKVSDIRTKPILAFHPRIQLITHT